MRIVPTIVAAGFLEYAGWLDALRAHVVDVGLIHAATGQLADLTETIAAAGDAGVEQGRASSSANGRNGWILGGESFASHAVSLGETRNRG